MVILSVIACLFYESSYYDDWMKTWWLDICHNTKYSVPCPISGRIFWMGKELLKTFYVISSW